MLPGIAHLFRSLRYRNFRLYFTGQVISLNGTWMQNVAQSWLVYRMTDSSFMLGVVAFMHLIPVLLFSLFGGVLADRGNRWRLLVWAHGLGLVQALMLATLTLGGFVQPWHVIVLAFFLGMVHALEMPARHSFVAGIVPRTELPNAIALNSSAFNVARFTGPAAAGLLVAGVGEGWVFLLNGFTFLAILLALLAMDHSVRRSQVGARSRGGIAEGLRFAWDHAHVRAGMLLVAMMGMVAASVTVLMPVYAREAFGGGSAILGVLLGAMGVGALLGALRLAQRTHAEGIDRWIGGAGVFAGIGLMLFTWVSQAGLALTILVLVGFCQTTLVAATNTLIQMLVPDALRGRTMSLFSTIFIGLMPIGSLVAGTLAEVFSAPPTTRGFALLCLGSSALFLWRVPRFQDRVEPSG